MLKYLVDCLADCGNEHVKGGSADPELEFKAGIRFSSSKKPQGYCKTLLRWNGIPHYSVYNLWTHFHEEFLKECGWYTCEELHTGTCNILGFLLVCI